MARKYNSYKQLLSDMAEKIRRKEGSRGDIYGEDMPNRIDTLMPDKKGISMLSAVSIGYTPGNISPNVSKYGYGIACKNMSSAFNIKTSVSEG